MKVSHKNDTNLNNYETFELFDDDKAGVVWYGDQAVAFVASDNQVHFLLPTHLLEEFHKIYEYPYELLKNVPTSYEIEFASPDDPVNPQPWGFGEEV